MALSDFLLLRSKLRFDSSKSAKDVNVINKQKVLACAVLAVISAQSDAAIIGSLDIVNQRSAFGWACDTADVNSFPEVWIWARSVNTGTWTLLERSVADKERNDVYAVGACGSGANGQYHGFEFSVFPIGNLSPTDTYQITAWVDNATQLPGSATVNFAPSGFPTSMIYRTDYDDPNQRSVAMVSCIWPFKGANPMGNNDLSSADPLFINPYAGATILIPWDPLGNGQPLLERFVPGIL